MNCDQFKKMAGAYLDRDLEEQLLTMLESHADSCSDCTDDAADLQACLTELQKTFPDQKPPSGLWEKIQSQVTDLPC